MKTVFTKKQIAQRLNLSMHTISNLIEGEVSQAFLIEIGDKKKVLRLADTDAHYLCDDFAFRKFGNYLPIPEIYEIGSFTESSFYCISEFIEGKTLNAFTNDYQLTIQAKVHSLFSMIFNVNINDIKGYGPINPLIGDAKYSTIQEAMRGVICSLDDYINHGRRIGLAIGIISNLYGTFHKCLPYVSSERHLLHGDPGFDNILIRNDKIVAVIDWAQMGVGDWMSDFARVSFWRRDRAMNYEDFALQHALDDNKLNERMNFFWAVNALLAIEFASTNNNSRLVKWLINTLE